MCLYLNDIGYSDTNLKTFDIASYKMCRYTTIK